VYSCFANSCPENPFTTQMVPVFTLSFSGLNIQYHHCSCRACPHVAQTLIWTFQLCILHARGLKANIVLIVEQGSLESCLYIDPSL
jgi:hypothetical protein